jgi:hypothetical protein
MISVGAEGYRAKPKAHEPFKNPSRPIHGARPGRICHEGALHSVFGGVAEDLPELSGKQRRLAPRDDELPDAGFCSLVDVGFRPFDRHGASQIGAATEDAMTAGQIAGEGVRKMESRSVFKSSLG